MDKRLKEIAFGEWEGKSVARNQMEVPDEFLKFYDDPEHFAGAPVSYTHLFMQGIFVEYGITMDDDVTTCLLYTSRCV